MKCGNNQHCLSILIVDAKKADADIDASSVNELKKQEIGYAELKVWERHQLLSFHPDANHADAGHLDKDDYFVNCADVSSSTLAIYLYDNEVDAYADASPDGILMLNWMIIHIVL